MTKTHKDNKQSKAETIEPAFLSISTACDYFDLCPASIYRLLGLGKLKAVKFGAKTLITMASAQAYAASLPAAKIKPPTNRMTAARMQTPPR